MKQIKKFDCIEFKRKAQARIFEKIKNMSWEEEKDYFKKGAETGPSSNWWKKVKAVQEPRNDFPSLGEKKTGSGRK